MFTTKEEIEEYFSHDKIQCLECGKWYRALNTHLRLSHEITVDDYRDKYGLPYQRGLLGKLSLEKAVNHGKETWEKGHFTKEQVRESIKKAQAAVKEKRRTQPFDRNIQREKAAKKSTIGKIADINDLKKLRGRCFSQDRNMESVTKDKDILTQRSLMRLLGRDRRARKYYDNFRKEWGEHQRKKFISKLIEIEKRIGAGESYWNIVTDDDNMPSYNKIRKTLIKNDDEKACDIIRRIKKLIAPKMVVNQTYKIPCRDCGEKFKVNYFQYRHFIRSDRSYKCHNCKKKKSA